MNRIIKAGAVLGAIAVAQSVLAGEWSGYVSGEFLGFWKDADLSDQHQAYLSLAAEPEYYNEWQRGDYSVTITPFGRVDQHDSKRTHFDLREAQFTMVRDAWELKAGISKVFWGVTEAIHLVDVINQTDLVENLDGEDKLGQPMVQLSTVRDWGTVDFFVLPGWRERTLPGKEGRPRLALPTLTDGSDWSTIHDADEPDLALRWSHYFGPMDIGVSHFHGKTREPIFEVEFVRGPGGQPVPVALNPVYEDINQTGLDVQATLGSWLWKLEAIRRTGQGDRDFWAAAGGFEYTFVGVRETQMDVGVITEYLWDERPDTVSQEFAVAPYENDIVLGTRLTFNDVDSTELLASVIVDLDGDGYSYNLEASRRFGDQWKLSLEMRGIEDTPSDNVLHSFKDDDSVRMDLAYYF